MSRTRPPKAVRSILYIHWKLRYYPSNNPMNYLATNVTKKLDHNMADETPIQVLKEEGRRPQSKSYVWLVRTGDNGELPIILYNYTPTRAGSHAAAFLAGADPGILSNG